MREEGRRQKGYPVGGFTAAKRLNSYAGPLRVRLLASFLGASIPHPLDFPMREQKGREKSYPAARA